MKSVVYFPLRYFLFFSIDGSKQKGEPLRYGDLFYLCTLDNEGGNVIISFTFFNIKKGTNQLN